MRRIKPFLLGVLPLLALVAGMLGSGEWPP